MADRDRTDELVAWFTDWARSLDDDELRDARFDLYDGLELAPNAPALLAALTTIEALEQQRVFRRSLRNAARVAAPDIDADAFAEALFALVRAQRQLYGETGDAVEVFGAALQIAECRANPERTKGR